MRSISSWWARTTEVTIAIPSAASVQPWRSHWPCASRIGSRSVATRPTSDVAAVLAADLEERLGDLLQRADASGVHQHGEDVLAAHGGLLQSGDRCGGLV